MALWSQNRDVIGWADFLDAYYADEEVKYWNFIGYLVFLEGCYATLYKPRPHFGGKIIDS